MGVNSAGRTGSHRVSTQRAAGGGTPPTPKVTTKTAAQARTSGGKGYSGESSFSSAPTERTSQRHVPGRPQTTSAMKMPAISQNVEGAIHHAAKTVGVNYGYMMAMAWQESTFNPTAKADTSSATGLYQFLDKTWLGMIKDHGAAHGLGEYANQIIKRGKSLDVADPAMKQRIMGLRTDPWTSAIMGAEFAKGNAAALEKSLGRKPETSELYIAHFMGSGEAARLIRTHDTGKGDAIAAEMFQKAAGANANIFYKDGKAGQRPRTVSEVYDLLNHKVTPRMEYINETGRPKTFDQYTYNGGSGPDTSAPDMFDHAFGSPSRPGGSFGFGPFGTPTPSTGPNRFDDAFGSSRPPGGSFGFEPFGTPPGGSSMPMAYPSLGIGTLGSRGGLGSFGFGPHGIGPGASWGMSFDRNGIGTIGGSRFGQNGFGSSSGGLNGLGIGSIGSPGLLSFGINGGIGSGSTYGRAGGWQFGVGFDFSRNKVKAPSFSTGLGLSSGSSYGIGGMGGTSFGGSAFSISGATPLSGGGVRGSSSSSTSFGGTSYGGAAFSSFGSSPIGGGSFSSGGGSSSSFNGSGK